MTSLLGNWRISVVSAPIMDSQLLCGLAIALIASRRRKIKKSSRKCWTKKWLLRRTSLGVGSALLRELAAEEPMGFKKYVRMDVPTFHDLLRRNTPEIRKANTNMRESIPPAQRLAVTLRYMATGKRVGIQTD